MALPGITVTTEANGLGITRGAARAYAAIGTASMGPLGEVVGINDPTVLTATFGASGPLVEDVAFTLATAGGPVYCVRIAASNVGSVGTVVHEGTGPGTGVATTGTPLDTLDVVVKITKGGAVGTSTFRLSLDGGDNFSTDYATAATVTAFAAETGLTLTFAAGTYVEDDTYALTAAGPTYSPTDLAAALDTLRTSSQAFEFIHIIGTTGGVSDAAKVTNMVALASAIEVKLAQMYAAGRYKWALIEAPVVSDAALDVPAVASLIADRTAIAVHEVEATSALTLRSNRRHLGMVAAAKIAKTPVHKSIGHVGSGSLEGVTKLYRDEFKTPGLDDLRFITARTLGEDPGFYLTQGRTFAAPDSDFSLLQYRRVMDLATTVARRALLPYINADLRIEGASGFIDKREAAAIERFVAAQLDAALVSPGHASSASVHINRTTNLLSSQTLPVRVRVVPRGVVQFIDLNIGMVNPLASQAAALWRTIRGPTRRPTATSRQKSTSTAFSSKASRKPSTTTAASLASFAATRPSCSSAPSASTKRKARSCSRRATIRS
jgi:hypothetical protein